MKKQLSKNYALLSFLISLLLSALIFLPFLIYDKGLFIYYGDYDVQQIPFYILCHDAIRSGETLWSFFTDLGSNFVGSYAFYTLGSPFFWLTIPFPSAAVPYLMAPLLMLKFSFTSLTAFYYVKRFVRDERYALIAALIYSFSGFNIYNIFFNHFNEVVMMFPLLLIGMEEFVVNKRHGIFVLSVAACAFVNYYFFFGQVIFCVIYFFVRLRSIDFSISIKRFIVMVFEAILGLLLSMGILLPALLAVLTNSRLSQTLEGFNLLIYSNAQRYGLILSSFFFPPDIPARPNFFPDSNAKWSSVSMFLPMFSMSGVIAFFQGRKKHFAKTLIIISVIICFVPFLNASFSLFNYSYYARWYYMPLLIMSLATAMSLEKYPERYYSSLKITALFISFFALIGIMPKRVNGELTFFSLTNYPERFWAYVFIAVFGILCTLLIIIMSKHHKHFFKVTIICICSITFIYSTFMIFCGKLAGHGYDTVVTKGINGAQNLNLDEDEFFRIDSYDEMDNLGMFLKLPTINAFHSVVPSSIVDYYELVGGERGVASRPEPSLLGVRALCSVKYTFVKDTAENEEYYPLYGFEYYDTQNGYKIYENNYFVPMGFAYDSLITKEQTLLSGQYTDRLLLKGIYLEEEAYQKYSPDINILSDDDCYQGLLADDNDYAYSCKELKKNSVSNFEYSSSGFSATYKSFSDDEFVFFSVPYDSGFTAYINGEEVEILKANGGFMAIKVSQGQNNIVFKYQTPGLNIGIIISISAIFVYIGYMVIVHKIKKRRIKSFEVKTVQ